VQKEWLQGWKLVLSAAMGMGLTAAPIYSLGVFFAPLTAQFGWSRADMAVGVSITSVITGGVAPFVGRLIDWCGARKIALAGTFITCSGVAAFAASNGSILWYWTIWVWVSIGFAFGAPLSWTLAVATRFTHSRGLALSITLCGTNLIGAIAPPLATILVEDFGWRITYVALGLAMFVTTCPLALAYFYDASDLLRRKGKSAEPKTPIPSDTSHIGRGATFRLAIRTRAFWLMAISFLFGGGGLVGLIVHFIPMLIDNGMSPLAAASAASVLSIAAIIGRIAGGLAMDRFFAPRIAGIAFIGPILACGILVVAPEDAKSAFAAGALVGLALGAEYNLMSYLSARYFGFKQYGVIYGAIFGSFTFGQAIMPPVVGDLYGATGNYRIALILLGLCMFISAALMQLCGRYPEWGNQDSPEIEDSPETLSAGLKAGIV